jgi:poly(A) polymerase
MTALDPQSHPWMRDARTQSVMRALTQGGGQARFVGGAVRNALIGAPVMDVDIATPLLPDEVVRRLQAAGLQSVPTGIEHGTVTAIAEKTPFEVTTLRRDVATDGRRAVVAFTTDWKEDASRRDFTMNALYADETGQVFDYFGGIEDLRAGRVRFIGDARARIREDYLRILRLFRFYAWYGKGEIGSDALAACAAEKAGLKSLSGERVQKEFFRLLETSNPVGVLRTMKSIGILDQIFPVELDVELLAADIQTIEPLGGPSDVLTRFSVLLPRSVEVVENVAAILRLSNADKDRLVGIAEEDPKLKSPLKDFMVRAALYDRGPASASASFTYLFLRQPGTEGDDFKRETFRVAKEWRRPKFPVDGRDVKALGVTEGPRVGALLHELEQWWIAEDFKPSREELLARLKAAVQQK